MPMVRVSNGGTTATSLVTTRSGTNTLSFTAQNDGVCLIIAGKTGVSDTTITINGVNVTSSIPTELTMVNNSNCRAFLVNVKSGDAVTMTTSNYGIQYFMMS